MSDILAIFEQYRGDGLFNFNVVTDDTIILLDQSLVYVALQVSTARHNPDRVILRVGHTRPNQNLGKQIPFRNLPITIQKAVIKRLY